MIHEKIEKVIPYVEENFITYPLWEEGKYIPFVNFWQAQEYDHEFNRCQVLKDKGYRIELTKTSGNIHGFFMYPDYNEKDDGGYEYVNKNWSIEEMLDLLATILK